MTYGASTQTLRGWYAPPCQGVAYRFTLNGGAVVTIRAGIAAATDALNKVFIKHGYRATPPDCGAYNCRPITGGTNYSLHAYGIAIDVNWQDNPYGPRLKTDMSAAMIRDIKAIRTKSGAQVWRWGGDYSSNKDAMHFEIICSPGDLATGIKGVGGPAPLLVYKGSPAGQVKWVQTLVNGLTVIRKGKTGKPGKKIAVNGVFDDATVAASIETQKAILAIQRWCKVPRSKWTRTDGVWDQTAWDALVFWYTHYNPRK